MYSQRYGVYPQGHNLGLEIGGFVWVVTPPDCITHSVTVTGPSKTLFPCFLTCSFFICNRIQRSSIHSSFHTMDSLILGQVLRENVRSSMRRYLYFFCASSKSPDPPSENHDLGEIYSRLNHKPLECVNMYLKQIFLRKMSHYSICNSCCLCKGKMWDLCYTLHKQGMEGKD